MPYTLSHLPALTFDFKTDSQELAEILHGDAVGENWTIWENSLLACKVATLKEKRAVISKGKSPGRPPIFLASVVHVFSPSDAFCHWI